MKTVAANVEDLTVLNREMAVALERAENGSEGEDDFFIGKLHKSATVLGYCLTTIPDDDSSEEY